MKKQMVVVLGVMLFSLVAGAQGLVPDIPLGEGKLKISGWFQETGSLERVSHTVTVGDQTYTTEKWETDYQWSSLRLRLQGIVNDDFAVVSVMELSALQKPDGNWWQELYLRCQIDPNWQLRVGRLFSSATYSTPAPKNLETISYPKACPFQAFVYGAQFLWQDEVKNPDWNLMFEVSAQPGKRFSDSEAFKDLWLSARLQRNWTNGYLAATLQASADIQRFGFDGEVKPVKSLTIRGGLWYEHNKSRVSDGIGAYVLTAYRPFKRWEIVHGMFDYHQDLAKTWTEFQFSQGEKPIQQVTMTSSNQRDTTLTVGSRVFFGQHDDLSFTLDCLIPLADTESAKDPKFQARVQLVF